MNENIKFLRDFGISKETNVNKYKELKSTLIRDIIPKLEDCKELQKEDSFRNFFIELGFVFGKEKVIVKINKMKFANVYHKTYCIAKNIDLSSNFFR